MPDSVSLPGAIATGFTRPVHASSPDEVLARLESSASGLSERDVRARRERHGPNRLDPPRPPSRWLLFARQFTSPLIYILFAAAAIALALGEQWDAGFIAGVLLINAVIGFINEARAERKIRSLGTLVRTSARVRRAGETVEIDGEELVPGDIVLLESGCRVPADIRLLEVHGLRVDEGLLTGESAPVHKDGAAVPPETPLAERKGMAFGGSMVASGRGTGVVVAIGPATEVGAIAHQLQAVDAEPPPLIVRMERFARVVGGVVLAVSALVVVLGMLRGQPLREVLLGAIALAVSAVPEGLPIALTVALAVAVGRMAGRKVIVRHLPAVEGLGSCGVIATDKTGTLTRNQLTVEAVLIGSTTYEVTGVGYEPAGDVLQEGVPVSIAEHPTLYRLLRAGVLANEGTLTRRSDATWSWSGDPTDVALLAAAFKAGLDPWDLSRTHVQLAALPFEPERRYAASFRTDGDRCLVAVKGAPERVLDLCASRAVSTTGSAQTHPLALEPEAVIETIRPLMARGFRMLALAEGRLHEPLDPRSPPPEPADLELLGFVAITDPPREGVEDAVARCHRAGIRVLMITGDHAMTGSAIAARVGLATGEGHTAQVLEGGRVAAMTDDELVDALRECVVVARATPEDKLRVVRALQTGGAFVAVTGDGVNDAPALRQANLGVAMGRSGTDVAREAAELVITDDDFSSIVAGVEEGRVAYDNVRKVTYLLVSTGAGEVLLVLAAVAAGLPVPFTAAQLLWLNLVTNGIQDVALAFEPGEPGVLDRPPRPPRERIFDRVMIERTVLAGLTFAGLGLACWLWWLGSGLDVPQARNLLVQLFVMFEIMHIGNARSESVSIFRLNPLRNPILVLGTLGALSVHLAATHMPLFQRALGVEPIPLTQWAMLAAIATAIIVVMEAHKKLRMSRHSGKRRP